MIDLCYFAVGDGVTDDSPGIQKAVNAAEKAASAMGLTGGDDPDQRVWVLAEPGKTYLMRSPVHIPTTVGLRGVTFTPDSAAPTKGAT